MRESIGTTWIFSICLTFIVLFTAYLAISVNYAKAFKIKSYIVNMIEENDRGYLPSMESEIEEYLVAQGYTARGTCSNTIYYDDMTYGTNWEGPYCIEPYGGTDGKCAACIYKLKVTTSNDDIDADKVYYKVVTFFKFDLPVIGYMTTFQVSGESKTILES